MGEIDKSRNNGSVIDGSVLSTDPVFGLDRRAMLQAAVSRLCQPLAKPNSTLTEIAQAVLREASLLTQSAHGYVSMIDAKSGDNKTFVMTALMPSGHSPSGGDSRYIFRKGPDGRYGGLWGHALNTLQPFFTNTPHLHPASIGVPAGHLPVERFLTVPVLLDQELVGQIALANSVRDYIPNDLEAVTEIASLYALALQRMRYQEALQEASEQRRLALAAGKLGIWNYDLATGNICWDERCFSLFGVGSVEKIQYDVAMSIIHPEDRASVDQAVKRALRGDWGGAYSKEYRVVWPDGTIRWVAAYGQVHFQEVGAVRKAVRFVGTVQDITERKYVEVALEESVEQFRTILEHSNDAIFWADPETGRILRCNRKAEQMTERSRQELIGLHQKDLHPNDRDYGKAFQLAIHQPTASNIEAEVLSRSGKRIPVMINAAVVTIGQKRIVQGVFRDITARKNMEEALSQREKLFRALFEQAAVGVVQIAAITGHFLQVNSKFCEIIGRSSDELRTLTHQQLTHPEDLPRFRQHIERLLQGQVSECSLEQRYLKENGAVVWVKLTVSPLWSKGQPCSHYMGVVEDITRRKQTEEALELAWVEMEQRVEQRTAELREANEILHREIETRQKTEAELSDAEVRYRIIVEFTHDWAYWESPEGILKYCSPSCERVTGYTVQEFISSPDLIHLIIHPEDQEIWKKHRATVSRDVMPDIIKFRILRKDKKIVWVEHTCQRILSQDGEFLGYRSGNRDITLRMEAELEKQRLREELTHFSRMTTAGQFAASLAHELNQPLTAIHFNTQAAERFLAMDPPQLDEVREALLDIQSESQRAGKVIYHLRAFFKKSGHEHAWVPVNEIIREMIGLLSNEFLLRNVSALLALDSELPLILGNRVELQQVILNLVQNALEAMSEVELELRQIQITTERESPTSIQVTIRDSGSGIPEAKLMDLFRPFFTTKPNGMGMGLIICKNIIESHGGRLWAENNSDGGATFFLSLPISFEEIPK